MAEWEVRESVRTSVVIPATAGFIGLRYWPDDEEIAWVERAPVVAWRIDGSVVTPICVGIETEQTWWVLRPDGVVTSVDDEYSTEQAWLAAMREFDTARQK